MNSDLRNQNYLDKITYQCCGRVQTGTSPVLLAAEPCKVRNLPAISMITGTADGRRIILMRKRVLGATASARAPASAQALPRRFGEGSRGGPPIWGWGGEGGFQTGRHITAEEKTAAASASASAATAAAHSAAVRP
jgi:hypothetical protein